MDCSDYWLSDWCFRELVRYFGPFSVDYFASDRSFRMKPYFARFTCGESQGVDAFSVSWRRGKGFFHPPVGLVSRVVRKAERERAEGLLVVPEWLHVGVGGESEDKEVEVGEDLQSSSGVS